MIDTGNVMMVGVQGDDIVLLAPVLGRKMSRDTALNMAAWIVALADPGDEDFTDLLAAVRST